MPFDFTIATPVYNRAELLPRLYQSLVNNCSEQLSFEWLLVDDGSTDDIEGFINKKKAQNLFSFRYIKKKNEGKHSCLNHIFEKAQGQLTLILDSDDVLVTGALAKVKALWDNTATDKANLAGVIGLCETLGTGKVSGDCFPRSPMYSTLLNNSYKLNMTGDRCDFIRTELLRNKKFPIIEGEKFMPEAVVMLDFDIDYQYLCVNETFKDIEYQSGGISNNFAKLSMKNPEGMLLRFERILNEQALLQQVDFKAKVKMYGNHSRYLLHSKNGFLTNFLNLKKYYLLPCLIGVLAGFTLYCKDKLTIKV
jgi:glycosyltransferase involved in cell wall biosynthesis